MNSVVLADRAVRPPAAAFRAQPTPPLDCCSNLYDGIWTVNPPRETVYHPAASSRAASSSRADESRKDEGRDSE